VALSPEVVVRRAFVHCLSVEVLAVSVGFEVEYIDLNKRFAKWRNQIDDNKE